jgi:hypothetical protein
MEKFKTLSELKAAINNGAHKKLLHYSYVEVYVIFKNETVVKTLYTLSGCLYNGVINTTRLLISSLKSEKKAKKFKYSDLKIKIVEFRL